LPNSYEKYLLRTLLDAETLQNRIEELGTQISADYVGRGDLVLVCILKGGVLFLCDLMRSITVPHSIEFMAVSSYGVGGRESSGHVRILMDLSLDINGKHVLIVEDIIDSGHTLAYIVRQLKARNPATLSICTLLSKPSRREIDVPVEYLGFEIPNEFVFGYGLDLDDKFRNLPFVGVIDLEAYQRDHPSR
jgi:hypoxanthine phosphoribosyltransferase